MTKLKTLVDTRNKIKKVVSEIESFVCPTMGPSGQTIAIHNEVGAPIITKDGVSVAKAFEGDDATEQLIADIVKQAAEKTNDEAGDGTTTSIAITSAVIREGIKLLAAEHDVNVIRKNLEQIIKKVQVELEKQKVEFSSKSEEEITTVLYKIAMISSNGDHEISTLIANAVAKAGRTGLVIPQRGMTKYELTQANGMKVPQAGLVSYDFIMGCPDKKMMLEKCYILITTQELSSAQVINDLSESIFKKVIAANASILFITKKSDKSFLANMINNNAKGHLKNAIVKAPYFGTVGREMMEDVAAYVGGKVLDDMVSWKNVKLEHLGYAEKVEVTPWHTYIFEPRSDKVKLEERISILEDRAKKLEYRESDADKTMERLTTLTGNSYTISIPCTSDIEYKERMDRVEDAINACKGALESGYLSGGGTALLNVSLSLNAKDEYERLMMKIIEYPFKRILTNAGEIPEVISLRLQELGSNFVYDARDRRFGESLEIGVIDSFKVVEKSLLNGFSVGLLLLTTTGILANVPETNIHPYDLGY